MTINVLCDEGQLNVQQINYLLILTRKSLLMIDQF